MECVEENQGIKQEEETNRTPDAIDWGWSEDIDGDVFLSFGATSVGQFESCQSKSYAYCHVWSFV